jgi:glycosyltransferase involved in cell wall biosynthesis
MHKKQLVYVGFAFSHHGKYSGYNQIKEFIKYDKFIDCQKSFDLINSFRNNKSLLARLYFKIFGSRLWMVEFKLIILSLFYPDRYIFHIIYGENIFKYLGYFKRRNEVVLTLHQPPAYFEENYKVRVRSLVLVDKLIVMSKEMESYFMKTFQSKTIRYIPHGVNTEYFKPFGEKQNQILMIGNWLRDFNYAAKLFDEVKGLHPDIEIIVLTAKKNHFHFENSPVKLLSYVSDSELISLYQASKIIFLPLISFTANNALLEGAACGCNIIIVTDNPSTNYFDEDLIKIYPKNVQIIVHKIYDQLNSSQNSSVSLRQMVEERYSWAIIGKETMDFLQTKN